MKLEGGVMVGLDLAMVALNRVGHLVSGYYNCTTYNRWVLATPHRENRMAFYPTTFDPFLVVAAWISRLSALCTRPKPR